jgi:hypothetical protein
VLGKLQLAKDEKARGRILSGIKISEQLSQRPDAALGHFFLGEFYADRGEKQAAIPYLKKALMLFEEMQMQFWPNKAQKVLASIAR